MKAFKYIFALLFLGVVSAAIFYLISDKEIHPAVSSVPEVPSVKESKSVPVQQNENMLNAYLTDWLQNELKKRIRCNTNHYQKVAVEVDNNFRYDYGVEQKNGSVILKAKDQKTAIWLIEQYIRHLANTDACIDAVNLPPMMIDIRNEPFGNFDFVYREPHFSTNLERRLQPVSGANSVEEYWDLWGHNLDDELKKYGLGRNIYMDGNPRQICFSKQILFDNFSEYLKKRTVASDNRKLHSGRFLIMPLDNMVACVCPKCRSTGNSDGYATPAVVDFLDRLADKFPGYAFYTAAYHSTAQPPKQQPKHRISGVIISASELYTGEFDQQTRELEFLETARKWKSLTDTLFVWDYATNFKDYLTPLPVLYELKKKLKFFRDCGITGIFLQGSSYDYSPFDDVKTYAATALMINGRLDVDMLCRHYFAQFYPVSAEILADYYLSLEKTMEQRKKPYRIDGSLGNAIDSYFIIDDFLAFYRKLGYLVTDVQMGDDEKKQLEKLYTALSFTWLQIAFHQQTGLYNIENIRDRTLTVTPETDMVIKRLSQYRRHKLINYREKDGYLGNYLKSWEKHSNKITPHQPAPLNNR